MCVKREVMRVRLCLRPRTPAHVLNVPSVSYAGSRKRSPACTKEQETMRTQRSHNTCCNSSVEEALVVCAANCVKYIPAYLLSGLVFE